MRIKPKAMISIAIVAAVMAAASFNVYFIREYSGGTALWNASEAYVFTGFGRQGHHVRCLRYPWFSIKQYLGGIEDADDDRDFLVVFRITSSGVERHALKVENREPGMGPEQYTPLEGRIYVNYPALGGLCWWAGDHFEPATQEERRRLGDFKHLTEGDIENDANGWSKCRFAPTMQDKKFTIDVGGKFRVSITNLAERNGTNGTVLVDVLRSGKAPERIWDFYARRGMVSWAEYKLTFR